MFPDWGEGAEWYSFRQPGESADRCEERQHVKENYLFPNCGEGAEWYRYRQLAIECDRNVQRRT